MLDKPSSRFTWFSIFKQAHWRQTPGACFFLSFLAVLYVFIGLKLIVPGLAERGIKQFHLTVESYPEWFLMQPIPAMYNFGNEIWIGNSPHKPLPVIVRGKKKKHFHTWVNHYPLRVVTFNWTRPIIVREKGNKYITLKSHYRGQEVETVYFLKIDDGEIYMKKVQ